MNIPTIQSTFKFNQELKNKAEGIPENLHANNEVSRTDSTVERIDGDGASTDKDLIWLEIGNFHILPELQRLRTAEPGQQHRSAARNHRPPELIKP